MKVTDRIRMISIFLSIVLMLVQINLCVIADESTASNLDIRFDFIDDLDGMTAEGKQFGGVRSEIINENGEAVLTGYHTSGKASETIALNTSFVDLGDGGYYMYAKVKYELPDRTTNRWSSIKYGTRTQATDSFVSVAVRENNADLKSWDLDTYKVIKIDTSSLTDLNQVQLLFTIRATEFEEPDIKLYFDWVIFSKDSALNENIEMLSSISDGINTTALEQNGDITEMEITGSLYDILAEGITNELPSTFTATLADNVSDVVYTTSVSDKESYKIIDVCVNGTLNGVQKMKNYRIKAIRGETIQQEIDVTPDMRFDFIDDLEGMTAEGKQFGGVRSDIINENGEAVLTGYHTSGKASETIALNTPFVDLGDGGYYMYAKVKYELPDRTTNRWSSIKYGTRTQTTDAYSYTTVRDNDADLKSWDLDTYKVIKINTSSLTDLNQIQFLFTIRATEFEEPDIKLYFDWIIFSRDPLLSENINLLTALIIGDNSYELKQDSNLTEISVAQNIYNSFEVGTVNGLPNGITVNAFGEVNIIGYKTIVTENLNYKILDILTLVGEQEETMSKHYRVKVSSDSTVTPEPDKPDEEPDDREPIECYSDIRVDFIDGLDGADKGGGISKTCEVLEGNAVITGTNTTSANNIMAINLPYVDFGEGGYYMYAKVKYDLPDTATNRWSRVCYAHKDEYTTNFPSTFTDIYSTNSEKAWSGYKVIKIDTRTLVNSNQIQLRFITRMTEPEGEVKIYVDWVVFSKNNTFDETTSVLTSVKAGDKTFSLPQNGDSLDVELNTSLYNSLCSGEVDGLPEGWSYAVNKNTNCLVEVQHIKDDKAKKDYKIMDMVVSDADNCRQYRLVARLNELEMKTSKSTVVSLEGAINIKKESAYNYSCDVYPRIYDLIQTENVVLSSNSTDEVVSIEKTDSEVRIVIKKNNEITFSLTCNKIKSDNCLELDAVTFNKNKIMFLGSVKYADNKSVEYGEIIIAAFDDDGNIKATKNVEIKDGIYFGEFTLSESASEADYYDMKIGAYALDTECIKTIKYYKNTVLQQAIAEVLRTEAGEKVYTAIKNSEKKPLFESMGISTNANVNIAEVDENIHNQIGSLTSENFAEIVAGTIVANIGKHCTDDEVIKAISEYDKVIKNIVVSGKSFFDVIENGKKAIVQNMNANNQNEIYSKWNNFENALKKSFLFYQISKADYKDVDKLIIDNADLLVYPSTSISNTSIATLKSADSTYADLIMQTMMNSQKSTMFASANELINDLLIAIEQTPEPPKPGVGGGSSGSGGGGSKDSFSVGMGATSIPNNSTTPSTIVTFNDLGNHSWAVEAIQNLASLGIVNGVGAGKYEPGRTVTREEFVKLICEAFNIKTSSLSNDFSDVDKNAWYYSYINAAVENGIVAGISENEFGIGKKITREDMAVMIYRAIKNFGHSMRNGTFVFADSAEISDYAVESVSALNNAGVITGTGNNMFSPKNYANRAEAAVVIHRCLKLYN